MVNNGSEGLMATSYTSTSGVLKWNWARQESLPSARKASAVSLYRK